METFPIQGSARHGAGGARTRREEKVEGKGLLLLAKLPNRSLFPRALHTPHPAPPSRDGQDRARAHLKRVAQKGPEENAALFHSGNPTRGQGAEGRGLRAGRAERGRRPGLALTFLPRNASGISKQANRGAARRSHCPGLVRFANLCCGAVSGARRE